MLHFNKNALKIFCAPLLFCILLVCAPRGAVAQAQAQNPLSGKNVLVLHSYEANRPVSLGTDKGLSDTLRTGGIPDLNQFFVSLDLMRNPASSYRKLLVEQMRTQYSHSKPDMIITTLPEALEFVLKDCRDTFSDVPIVALYLPQGFDLPIDSFV